jgi:hypothetical protein
MAFFLRCPSTGHNVQGWSSEEVSPHQRDEYETVTCIACQQTHLVKPTTGRVISSDLTIRRVLIDVAQRGGLWRAFRGHADLCAFASGGLLRDNHPTLGSWAGQITPTVRLMLKQTGKHGRITSSPPRQSANLRRSERIHAMTRKGKGDGQTQAKEAVDGSRVSSKPAGRWRARPCRNQTQAQVEEAPCHGRLSNGVAGFAANSCLGDAASLPAEILGYARAASDANISKTRIRLDSRKSMRSFELCRHF